MNYIQDAVNSIYYAFDEVKNFIVLLDKVYNSSHYDDNDDNDDNDGKDEDVSAHSHYTIANFFDIMGVYNDKEVQGLNVEIIDYLYHIVNKFFLFCEPALTAYCAVFHFAQEKCTKIGWPNLVQISSPSFGATRRFAWGRVADARRWSPAKVVAPYW